MAAVAFDRTGGSDVSGAFTSALETGALRSADGAGSTTDIRSGGGG
jgi:hypothetical protein